MAPPVCEEGLAAPQQHLMETPLRKQAVFSFLSTGSPLCFPKLPCLGQEGKKEVKTSQSHSVY